MLKQDLSRNPFCSHPADPQCVLRRHLLSASHHPDPQGHQCVSTLLCLHPCQLSAVSAETTEDIVGACDSAVIIIEVGMESPLFQCMMFN